MDSILFSMGVAFLRESLLPAPGDVALWPIPEGASAGTPSVP